MTHPNTRNKNDIDQNKKKYFKQTTKCSKGYGHQVVKAKRKIGGVVARG